MENRQGNIFSEMFIQISKRAWGISHGGAGMDVTGKRLRKLRTEKNMSQEEVAKILGISRTAYNKYESGVIKPVRKLKELSMLFGVSMDYILGEEDLMSRASIRDRETVRKYMSLSGTGKYMVNIMLDAVYEREKRS